MGTKSKNPDVAKAFERLVDDVRLKIHLSGMDARDAWASLTPDIDALRASLKRSRPRARRTSKSTTTSPARMAKDEIELQAHLAAMDASEQWEAVERRLAPILDHLTGAARSVADAANVTGKEGEARRAEAARNREAAKEELRKAGDHLRAAATDGLELIREGLDSLSQRLETVTPAVPPEQTKPAPSPA